jgi:CheY-like chemotaxis protein
VKILLIEDNQSNADIYIKMLGLHGYTDIDHTLSGVEGLNAARNKAYDLILIDFDLPDIHGSQVGLALATLMQRNNVKTVPLIALTAQSDKASQAKAERLGFDGFVGKPCLENDLIDIINQVMTP